MSESEEVEPYISYALGVLHDSLDNVLTICDGFCFYGL